MMSDEVMDYGDAIRLAKEFVKGREYPFFCAKDLKKFYLSRYSLYHKLRDGKRVRIEDVHLGNVLIHLVAKGLIRRYSRSTQKQIYEILNKGGG